MSDKYLVKNIYEPLLIDKFKTDKSTDTKISVNI